ncbi:hypothetical protein [uncultured Chryseobacterium sp.]|uniref:hypothetical protein n=1 Tax=uncultured Chryseobacterium sp. TaxID=259322 RepID=UPI00258FA4B9|nr:hypothetical protein [uncultured Chryseobacterium sp.]
MKKFLIPAALVIMGTGGALASNIESSSKVVTIGYRVGNFGEPTCVAVKNCETVNTGILCTYTDATGSHNLKRMSGSQCFGDLFEILP